MSRNSARRFLLVGTVISTGVLLALMGPVRSEPNIRLAQAAQPDPNQPPTKPGQPPPQRPQQRPPAAAPQAPAAQPPRPPQPPAVQAPKPPPASAPAQVPPPAPVQRPAQSAPPPPPPPQSAPAQRPVQTAPAQQPPQRPAQTAPTQPPKPGAPVQATPPAPAPQQPAQTAPARPGPQRPGVPPAPPQQPAQTPPQQAPAVQGPPPRLPQGVPAQLPPVQQPGVAPQAPATQTQRPSAPPLPAPTVAAPAATPIKPGMPGGGAALAPTSSQGQPLVRMDQLRNERQQTVEGNRTIIREPDRVIIRENDGRFLIRHSDVDRFRYGARDVRVERRGNDNVTVVVRPDGARVVTVVDQNGMLLRRSRILPDGREIIIIEQRPVMANYNYYVELPPPVIRIPRERYIVEMERASPAMIFEALVAPPIERLERPYTLDEIRYSPMIRERMPRIDIDTVNFEFGSWEITPDQIDRLAVIAEGINRAISANPRETFLIEGHTDAVGSDVDNLSLSDRRAESVALALSERFQVPAENLVTQGYGKQYLKIPTEAPERQNRRVTVRRITPLLAGG